MSRNPFLDQVKGVLIFFVVLGHFVVHLQEVSPVWGGVSNFIYSFHMPCFILLSGYLSKGVTTQRTKEIDTLLYPFVVFQILNFIFTYLTGYGHGSINLFSPAYLNWYIIALFFWRLFLPYFQKMKKAVVVITLAVLWFISGYGVPNSFLSFYRIFYFLPFFMLGYYIDDIEKVMIRMSKYKAIVIVVAVVMTIGLFALSFDKEMNVIIHNAFAPDAGYRKSIMSVVSKIVGMGVQFVMTFCFIYACYLVRGALSSFTKWGMNSIGIYIVHGFITLVLVPVLISKMNVFLGLSISILLSAVICWLLSREMVVKTLQPLLNLNVICSRLKINIYR